MPEGRILVAAEVLRRVFKLPDDMRVVGASWDYARDVVEVIVAHPAIPDHGGECDEDLPLLEPVYAEAGGIVHLVRIAGMGAEWSEAGEALAPPRPQQNPHAPDGTYSEGGE